jgi:hypothetical protein
LYLIFFTATTPTTTSKYCFSSDKNILYDQYLPKQQRPRLQVSIDSSVQQRFNNENLLKQQLQQPQVSIATHQIKIILVLKSFHSNNSHNNK